jgi:hypothetical protein
LQELVERDTYAMISDIEHHASDVGHTRTSKKDQQQLLEEQQKKI